jgi:hypothetical protein
MCVFVYIYIYTHTHTHTHTHTFATMAAGRINHPCRPLIGLPGPVKSENSHDIKTSKQIFEAGNSTLGTSSTCTIAMSGTVRDKIESRELSRWPVFNSWKESRAIPSLPLRTCSRLEAPFILTGRGPEY